MRRRKAAWLLITLMLIPMIAGCGRIKEYYSNRPISSDDPAQPGRPDAIGTILVGRVVDQQGNPIEGAMVMPSSRDNPPKAIPEIAVMTDAQGNFTWHLPGPGNYDITIIKDGYMQATLAIMAGPGQTNRDFPLHRAPQ